MSMENTENIFMTVEEAADFLKLSTSYLRKLISARIIPFLKFGRRVVFNRFDLLEWAQTRRINTIQEDRRRRMANCAFFNECSAPLCPLDNRYLNNCYWFPDEEICRKKPAPQWVKRQRKIAKALNYSFEKGYFTLKMLQRKCKVTKNFRGLNPDKGELKLQEENWLKKHPEYIPPETQINQGRKLSSTQKNRVI
ncbi:helix-turn-helix domain-containing protein [Candidatus Peregrinibacteria bacterium]|nr:helix-turn-helix domain-containing protein [Candidatus Peregrinibacteria bacterium]